MIRYLCIALHDVAPATWPQCARLLAMLDELGAAPVTLLVVPDFHGRGAVERHPNFIASIETRRARGDEIALHGYTHRDDASAPRTPAQWLRRRFLTAGEGEFAALGHDEAQQRIDNGHAMLSRLGWPVAGFVPPAWLASAGTRDALGCADLRYTSTPGSLIDLRYDRAIDAPCITASSRSAWRRTASRAWLRTLRHLTKNAAVLRIGLHPVDADHPVMLRSGRALLLDVLADRTPVTKLHAVENAPSTADARRTRFDVSGETPTEF
jgi:predicted deacetylase